MLAGPQEPRTTTAASRNRQRRAHQRTKRDWCSDLLALTADSFQVNPGCSACYQHLPSNERLPGCWSDCPRPFLAFGSLTKGLPGHKSCGRFNPTRRSALPAALPLQPAGVRRSSPDIERDQERFVARRTGYPVQSALFALLRLFSSRF